MDLNALLQLKLYEQIFLKSFKAYFQFKIGILIIMNYQKNVFI